MKKVFALFLLTAAFQVEAAPFLQIPQWLTRLPILQRLIP